MKNEFNQESRSQWRVVAEEAFTQGKNEHAAPELARQIDARIVSEQLTGKVNIAAVNAAEGTVIVECDDRFGMQMNDLPGARYAEKVQPVVKAGTLKR